MVVWALLRKPPPCSPPEKVIPQNFRNFPQRTAKSSLISWELGFEIPPGRVFDTSFVELSKALQVTSSNHVFPRKETLFFSWQALHVHLRIVRQSDETHWQTRNFQRWSSKLNIECNQRIASKTLNSNWACFLWSKFGNLQFKKRGQNEPRHWQVLQLICLESGMFGQCCGKGSSHITIS